MPPGQGIREADGYEHLHASQTSWKVPLINQVYDNYTSEIYLTKITEIIFSISITLNY